MSPLTGRIAATTLVVQRQVWAERVSSYSVIGALHLGRQGVFDPAKWRNPSKSFCCNFCCQTVQDCVASHNNNCTLTPNPALQGDKWHYVIFGGKSRETKRLDRKARQNGRTGQYCSKPQIDQFQTEWAL
jgi:hypothetical protein